MKMVYTSFAQYVVILENPIQLKKKQKKNTKAIPIDTEIS